MGEFKGDDGKFYYEEAMDKAKLDKKDMGPLERGTRSAWDKMTNRGESDGFRATSKSSEGASDKTSDVSGYTSDNNPHHSESKQSDNISKHHTPPSGESSTGSNPSHTNNSTTYPNTAQENLTKAQQNLAELKAMSPLDSAKNAIKLMAGTSVNPDSAEYKSFESKVDHNILMPRLTV